MSPAKAATAAENSGPHFAVMSFPHTAGASPQYSGDAFGDGVVFDWDFYHRVWTFYPFSWSEDDLVQILVQFVVEAGFVKEFDIPMPALVALMRRVQQSMHAQPYHNFQHICDVAQAVFMLICAPTSVNYIPPLHRLSVLLAAIMHDLDHPGFTNAFLLHSKAPLVFKYGPESTLEKHHAALALALLDAPETDVLARLPADDRADARRLIEKCILATDMSRHKAIVEDVARIMPKNYVATVQQHKAERLEALCHGVEPPLPQPLLPKPIDRRSLAHARRLRPFTRHLRKEASAPAPAATHRSLLFPPKAQAAAASKLSEVSVQAPQGSRTASAHSEPERGESFQGAETSASSASTPVARHLFDRRRSSIDSLIRSGQTEAVLLLFIKAADLSNVARPAHANERWVSRIYSEFHRQGRAEVARAFAVSPGMGEADSVAKGQVFFGEVICRPLFVMLAGVVPEAGLILDQLDENLERWKQAAALEESAAVKAE